MPKFRADFKTGQPMPAADFSPRGLKSRNPGRYPHLKPWGLHAVKIDTIHPVAQPVGPAAAPDAQRVQIAIVNSDPRALSALDRDLRRRGFDVSSHLRPDSALPGLMAGKAEVALLDMRTDDLDAYAVLRRLREHSSLPVVILTDSEDEVEEIVGLRMGADAVVRRPWSPQLLAERIRALSRRARASGPGQSDKSNSVISCPPLEIDTNRMVASWRGEALHLTATEFRLLQTLAERPGYVRTRDFLMDRLYGTDIFVLDRTVDSHVKRLRRKMRDIDPDFDAIETLYGTGYRLTLPEAEAAA